MKHGKKINNLGRSASHRKIMLAHLANSLLKHKRINTTLAKAKSLRMYIEPIISKSRKGDIHSMRMIFKRLQNKAIVSELFNSISEKVSSRPGGYTRIIKTGYRLGDGADTAIIEIVDFNETYKKIRKIDEQN